MIDIALSKLLQFSLEREGSPRGTSTRNTQ
jgi:hypothetical protein